MGNPSLQQRYLEGTASKWHTNLWPPSESEDTIPLEAKAGVIYQFPCKGCNAKYVGETGKTLKTRLKQHKAAIRNRYLSYLTTVHSLDTGHQFVFDEAQLIGQAQTKAGRLFKEAIFSDENSINRQITLDPWYALIKDRLTRWTVLIYYKNPCIKIYKRLRSGLATWPTKAPPK